MKIVQRKTRERKLARPAFAFLRMMLMAMALSVSNYVGAQPAKKGAPMSRSVWDGVPSGYSQVGSTLLYYRQTSQSIDIVGRFGDQYYSSTFSNNGYRLAIQVGNNSAVQINSLNGTTTNGVTCTASVEQQGELARVCYTVVNGNSTDVEVSLGTHADVEIGNNDAAPISRRIDTNGNTYGLTMKDGGGAQLCVLFGAGLSGVTSVDDFWFGNFGNNYDPYQMVGNYSQGGNYMVENGSYDSGMGWCWKNRSIPAGDTVVFSYLIGVGDVNLQPSSTFEVTPDDPEGWNDLSRPHRLTLEGEYESPAGLQGRIDYAVEDEEEWHALTGMLNSGDKFNASLVATFDASKQKHVIRFRTVDNVGNATQLPPIEYLDVSFYPLQGIADKVYTGDSIFQTGLTCELDSDKYVANRYINNVNAGTATLYHEGLFPYTIGRKAYNFAIDRQALAGGLTLEKADTVYVGSPIRPKWAFTESRYDSLVAQRDYEVKYADNLLPGTGTVSVEGIGNYKGVLQARFAIDKAQLAASLYSVTLPKADITYDGKAHAASVDVAEGVGSVAVTYWPQGSSEGSLSAPSAPGSYDVYFEISDGTLYYGQERRKAGTFAIYGFDAAEWAVLEDVCAQLAQNGWADPWNMSGGVENVGLFDGLAIRQGHVAEVDLSRRGLKGDFPWGLLGLPRLAKLNLAGNSLKGDIGTGMLAAVAANPHAADSLKAVDISDNGFSGNISLFANSCPALQSLDASGNCISDAMPQISPNVATLDLSGQTVGKVLGLDLANATPEAIMATMPTVLVYDHAAQSYRQSLKVLCTTARLDTFEIGNPYDWAVELGYDNGRLSIPYVSQQNAYYGESGDTINAMVLKSDGSPEGSTMRIKLSFAQGDANFNGGVDATDLQAIILRAFDDYALLPFNHTAANMVKDDALNVQDVVGEVGLLLGNAASAPLMASAASAGSSALSAATVYCAGGELRIHTTEPVAAFDIVVGNASGLYVSNRLESLGMACATRTVGGTAHIVGYSLSGGTLPVGETTVATLQGNGMSVAKAVLADKRAVLVPSSLNATPTGIGGTQGGEASVGMSGGRIVVNAGGTQGDTRWTVASPDGRVLGKGILPANSVDSHVLDVDVPGVVVVTLENGNAKITRKITNNR